VRHFIVTPRRYLFLNKLLNNSVKIAQKDNKMNDITKGLGLIFKGLFSPITALFRFINKTVYLVPIVDKIVSLEKTLKQLVDIQNNKNIVTLNPDTVTERLDNLEKDIAKLKQEDTDLGHIKAEALGMQVAREEYDWHREQRLVHNKMADNK